MQDDADDLFDDDDDDDQKMKELAEKKKAEAAAAKPKKTVVARSIVIFDVKVYRYQLSELRMIGLRARTKLRRVSKEDLEDRDRRSCLENRVQTY